MDSLQECRRSLERAKRLRARVVLQLGIVRGKPIDPNRAQELSLRAAADYHQLLWDNVPADFNALAGPNYALFKSTAILDIETLRVHYSGNQIEGMLADIAQGIA